MYQKYQKIPNLCGQKIPNPEISEIRIWYLSGRVVFLSVKFGIFESIIWYFFRQFGIFQKNLVFSRVNIPVATIYTRRLQHSRHARTEASRVVAAVLLWLAHHQLLFATTCCVVPCKACVLCNTNMYCLTVHIKKILSCFCTCP